MGFDVEPIPDEGDFAEGNSGLSHAEGAGVHAEEEDFFGFFGVSIKVHSGWFSCVDEGVVNMGDWSRKGEYFDGFGEISGYCDGFH